MLPAILLIAGFCVSQNQSLDTLRSHMSKLNISETSSYLEKIDTTTLKDYDKALWYFYSGLNYRNKDQHGLGFKDLREAERKFTSIDSLKDASDTNYEIVVLLSHQADNKVNPKPFLDKYIAFAELQANSLILARAYSRIASNYMHVDSFQKSQEYYLKTFNEIEKIKKKDIKEISNAKIKLNYGSLYRTVPKEIGRKKEYDSALYFYSKALPILLKYNLNNDVATTYNNIAYSYFGKKKFQKAIDFYKKADSVPLTENIPKTKVIFYKNMAEAFDSLKDYKSALTYYSKQIKLTDSINDIAQNLNMAELNKKYLNTELKAENLEEKAKNSKKTTQLTIALSILFLVIISAYLIQKNTRKKQLLAEQAKNLEAQKVSTLLKEQELASIDAMIEGQEKERKRIAEDLHDDLGALMATVKLHFDNIETAQNEEAVTKTSSLLDEAYEKIRSIAHAKNSGVIANQGLLVAVTNMASKISNANKIQIEVIAHGLEERLENSLELSLFRMIQELIANIIKHSEATNATIQLTQHEKNLNIIVEDNGKGFNYTNTKTTGIGLQTIQKRIEHLNGKLNVDSTLGKGTTILIDVPLT